MNYREFLNGKRLSTTAYGFEVGEGEINSGLFTWQARIVRWALVRGRTALFEDCGLGKTLQQLEWARHIWQHTDGMILLLTPLAVGKQTLREHNRFSINAPARMATCQDDCEPGINVANYEKLHLFDASKFNAVVLDESQILKSYTGATKRALIDNFRTTPYRLACTATPAPNDRMELGNHAEFLGIMPANEMLARWFINEGKNCGHYRLRKHATRDFWSWIASWAVCISKPSDLGFPDDGFSLPPLNVHEHIIDSRPAAGWLFAAGGVSAVCVHAEKRSCLPERADKVADLVNSDSDQWAVWCDTDYEADALRDRIPDAVEVRGSHTDKIKEDRLGGFQDGTHRIIITKPEIGGLGLNWQHAHKTTWFAGYSYEKFYQAIRRLWRYGQKLPVECHVVMSEVEQSIADVVRRKQSEHDEMKSEMAEAMKEFQIANICGAGMKLAPYTPNRKVMVPDWLLNRT